MLRAKEWADVRDAVAKMVALSNYRNAVRTIFTTESDAVFQRLKVEYSLPADCATDVVNVCLELRWSVEPSHMEKLLSHLANVRGVTGMKELAERVARKEDPLSSVYEAQWILGDLPFFDRESLRAHSAELIDEAKRPLLRVNGDPGFGRSYTSRFFDFLSQEKGDILHVAVARLEPKQAPSYMVDELAQELVSYMGNAKVPPRTGSSYPAALRRFMLGEASAKTGRWIFLLEGFDQRDVHPEVRELIQLLAQSVCDGDHRKRMRVVLIDYPADLPSVLPADILVDELKAPSELGTDVVVRCLVALDEKRKKLGRTPLNTNELGAMAKGILDAGPPEGKARLQHLYDKLVKIRDVA